MGLMGEKGTRGILGTVRRGEGYGKKLNYTTAKVNLRKKLRLPEGSYAGLVKYKTKFYKASIFLGKPKTIGQSYRIEAFLFNFRGSLYNKRIIFYIYKRVSGNRKLKNMAELKRKLADDRRKTLEMFKTKGFREWEKRVKRE